MKRLLFVLSIFASTPLAISACSSSSSSGPSSTSDGGGTGDGGQPSNEGGATDGGARDDFPGDPPASPGSSAPIEVTINGQARVFDGQSTWTKFPSEAGTIVGFQTNAKSSNDWVFVLAVFGNETGKTYGCNANVEEGRGGISLLRRLPDGGFDPDGVVYGGTVTSAECSIALDTYSPSQGGHVSGTFTAELDLSGGETTVTHLSLTDGRFDLVNYSDVPP